jgi:hypothetical protein
MLPEVPAVVSVAVSVREPAVRSVNALLNVRTRSPATNVWLDSKPSPLVRCTVPV